MIIQIQMIKIQLGFWGFGVLGLRFWVRTYVILNQNLKPKTPKPQNCKTSLQE
jgi:hypothetical protein